MLDLGYTSCAITDHGTISGAVSFTQAMKKKISSPFFGKEFYLSQQDCTVKDDGNRAPVIYVLAKNKKGWHNLIQAVSKSNDEENYYYKPRLDSNLGQFAGDMIAFSGHLGSDLANAIFADHKSAYNAMTIDEVKRYTHPDWDQKVLKMATGMLMYLEKKTSSLKYKRLIKKTLPLLTSVTRFEIHSSQTWIQDRSHSRFSLSRKHDANDQLLLLCSSLTTLPKIRKKLKETGDAAFTGFMRSNNFHIPSLEEIQNVNTPQEIATAMQIADMCEEYDILGKPMLPNLIAQFTI